MAIKQVILLTCDRCAREEQIEVGTYDEGGAVTFKAQYEQDVVEFKDLCKRCRERLGKLMSQFKLEKKDPNAEASSEPTE